MQQNNGDNVPCVGHQGRQTFDGESSVRLVGLSRGVVVPSDRMDSPSLEWFGEADADDVDGELQSARSSKVRVDDSCCLSCCGRMNMY